jgi:hypothetical protein
VNWYFKELSATEAIQKCQQLEEFNKVCKFNTHQSQQSPACSQATITNHSRLLSLVTFERAVQRGGSGTFRASCLPIRQVTVGQDPGSPLSFPYRPAVHPSPSPLPPLFLFIRVSLHFLHFPSLIREKRAPLTTFSCSSKHNLKFQQGCNCVLKPDFRLFDMQHSIPQAPTG